MTASKPAFDLIAIGESLRDVFYLINEATVSCSIYKDRCLLCLEYAEKIPVEQVVKIPAAGNSANAAVGASRLGYKTALVSWVGNDHAGRHLREALNEEGVDERFLTIDRVYPTSEATVIVFKGERTLLGYFQPRSYHIPRLPRTRCIYYSAMGTKHAPCDQMILKELSRLRTFFAFQPGTTHIRSGLTAITPLIARSDLFILNKDEAHHLLGDGERTLCNMLESFHHHGAKIVIITDGEKGADAWNGKEHWHMPIFDGQAVERTGAGDSFAISATIALINGGSLTSALRWGAANSWSVVREIGPQKGLLTKGGLQRTLKRFAHIKPELHKH